MKSKTRSSIGVIILLSIAITAFILLNILVNYMTPILWGIVGIYTILGIISFFISNKIESKTYDIIQRIIFMPLSILIACLYFSFVAWAFIIVFFGIITLSYLPIFSFLQINSIFNWYEFSELSTVYLEITSTIVFLLLLQKFFTKWCMGILALITKQNFLNIQSFLNHSLRKEVLVITIYILFFLFIIGYSFVNFEPNIDSFTQILLGKDYDKVILQSFVTFIALDRIINYLDKLNPSVEKFSFKLLKAMHLHNENKEEKTKQ